MSSQNALYNSPIKNAINYFEAILKNMSIDNGEEDVFMRTI